MSYNSIGIIVNGHELKVGSSVGIALYPDDGNSEDSLYKASDVALYDAKQKRSNYSFRSDVVTGR
jgi:GGDEF domain-containing protein